MPNTTQEDYSTVENRHDTNSKEPRRDSPRDCSPPPPPSGGGRDFIPENVGRVMYDSLEIFGLGCAVTTAEVMANFRAQARIYNPTSTT